VNSTLQFLSYLHEWSVDLNKNCILKMQKLDIRYGRWCNYNIICKRLHIRTSREKTPSFHTDIQWLIVNNNQLINIRQQQYYCFTDELKCHNLCSKYPPFFITQVWIRMSQPRHSVAATLSLISGDKQLNNFSFMNQISANTVYNLVYAPASTRKKNILGFWHITCCKLTPTLPDKCDVITTSSASMNI